MKLLSLNLWGGRQGKALFDFLETQAQNTDIFCFQEVFDSPGQLKDFHGARPKLFKELSVLLPDFTGYFAPTYYGWIDMEKVDFPVATGQACFIKNDLKVLETGSLFIFGNERTEILPDFINEPKNLQYLKINLNKEELLVVNVHGKWHPGQKLDTPEREEQSLKILSLLENFSCTKIVCGDFNLLPETRSINLLEQNLRNLITEFNIQSTRNKISWEEHNNIQYFADYVFVSREIKVSKFEVPYNEVSDHLPMLLEFTI